MPAQCWAHALGLAVVIAHGPTQPDPLGTCFESSVFVCSGHAEKDQGSGKWLCISSLAKALAASADIGEVTEELRISSSDEFEARFPDVTEATAPLRMAARDELHTRFEGTRLFLVGDAVGVARALVPAEPEMERGLFTVFARRTPGRSRRAGTLRYLFPGALGDLLLDLEP